MKDIYKVIVLTLPFLLLSNIVFAVDLVPYAWYHLNETTGTNIADSSGNNRNCTTVNNPLWVAGKLNNSLQFDGTTQYANCGIIGSFESTEPHSYEFWFNTTVATPRDILTKYSSAQVKGYLIRISNGKINFAIYSSSSKYIDIQTLSIWNNNYWHHAIITYDGSTLASGIKIYVDGVNQNLEINSNTLDATIINTATFNIGVHGTSGYWLGKLDEIVVYDKVLTLEEIAFRYNNYYGTELMSGNITTTTTTTTIIPANIDYNYFCVNNTSYENKTGIITGIQCQYDCDDLNDITYYQNRIPQGDLCNKDPFYSILMGMAIFIGLILIGVWIYKKVKE